ncbi:hypothetical protein ACFY1P_31385 [Streptomyces sp. NPDC001407]|uniref:tetratricopeptide repeat protein n=1 Tax=Streptomyces sp. NPDC001407 TaxID=3364573 RepID=UPI0036BDDF71
MEFGRAHGIQFLFHDGLLTSIGLDVHHKAAMPLAETLHAEGAPVTTQPLKSVVDHDFDSLGWSGALGESGFVRMSHTLSAAQDLSAGRRSLTLTQATRTGMPNGRIVATLDVEFTLNSPIEWNLSVQGTRVTGAPDDRVRVRCGQHVYVAIKGTVPVAFHDRGDGCGVLATDLPTGSSELTLSIVSNPGIAITDTVVVCRPDQVREAAIVVSCLPSGRFTPVVSLTPPPSTVSAYLGDLFQGAIENGAPDPRKDMNEFVRRGTARRKMDVTPYLSWARHNAQIARLLETARVDQVVWLFEPTFDDVQLPGSERSLFETVTDQVCLLPEASRGEQTAGGIQFYRDLDELALMAWHDLGGGTSGPSAWVHVPADDRTAYAAALFAALSAGLPLKPALDVPSGAIDGLLAKANNRLDADEAVLVEVNGVADDLLAALYALHRRARLVPTPPPRLDAVQEAVGAYQDRVLRAAGAARDASDVPDLQQDAEAMGGLTAAHRLLSLSGRNRFKSIERAVTAQVPPAVVDAVGNRRLTAFTAGMPYSFVRTDAADWSTKPIGHVAADPLLTILAELCAAGAQRPQATFSLLFDPGFFDTSETGSVHQAVERHYTHPIVLAGEDADFQVLASLPRTLPVELVFFNTHGSDDAILLSDVPLPGPLIPRYVAFESLPVVFNNSCESWTGVGKEFVRAGARGYVGSLWSIPSDLAARFATLVAQRILTGDSLIASALIGTGLPDIIARSYIYAGTANGRLDQWSQRTSTPGEAAIAACMTLLEADADDNPKVSMLLGREVDRLLADIEGTPYADTTEHADALIGTLRRFHVRSFPDVDGDRRAEHLIGLTEQLLNRLPQTEESRAKRMSVLRWIVGERHQHRHENEAALAAFEQALAYGVACPDRPFLQLRAAELLAEQGDLDSAWEYAQQAHDAYVTTSADAELIVTIGVRGQIRRRRGDTTGALRDAQEGYAAACRLSNQRQQAIFKGDESRAQLELGEYAAAGRAAEEELLLRQQSADSRGELSAYGHLAQALLASGNVEQAERYIQAGLRQARQLDEPKQEAAFLDDLGLVLVARRKHAKAVGMFRAALSIQGRLATWDAYAKTLIRLQGSAAAAGDADSLWMVVVHGTAVCPRIDADLSAWLFELIVGAFKRTILRARPPVAELLELLDQSSDGDWSVLPSDLKFIGDLAALTLRWMDATDHPLVVRHAQELDVLTGGRFELAEFFGVPPRRRSIRERWRRRRRD